MRLLGRCPLPLLHGSGWVLGQLLARVPNHLRLISAINLALCFPARSEAQRRRLQRRALIETCKTALELGPVLTGDAERITRRWVRAVHGHHHLEKALGSGRGLILLAPHLGCWELLNLWVAARYPLTALYRPPRQSALEPLLVRGRTRNGARMLPADTQGIRALIRALRAGEVVGILPDQEPAGSEPFAPFFGVPAKTMTLASRLAHKSQAAVVFGFAKRLPAGGGFELHFLPAPEGVAAADPHIATAALNRGVEACVQKAPTQYQWTYKRFATCPDGSRRYPRRQRKGRKGSDSSRASSGQRQQ
ncbi:lipid A biosynthesis acyltransferase [Halorhodospira abdelmalekii]|nr:lysophospholipid acyltransferase family protein [Halorhodospira abdelmalekii]MBK1735358.1 lipid A biosynthesis acyltransferase [Halorhodospira abdelmalekii]